MIFKKRHKTDLELELLELEVELKKISIREATRIKRGVSPILATIFAALIGFIATVITSFMNTQTELELENAKFQSSLILKAIESGNKEDASKMLEFLLSIDVLEDKTGKIDSLVKSGEIPVITNIESGFIEQVSKEAIKKIDSYYKQLRQLIAENEIEVQLNKINGIKKLFSEDAQVQLASMTSSQIKQYPIHDYLLKIADEAREKRILINQDVSYEIGRFMFFGDGYEGTINVWEKYEVFEKNVITYSDVTKKRFRIKLRKEIKLIEGVKHENWRIYIGEIQVSETVSTEFYNQRIRFDSTKTTPNKH